MKTAYVDTTIVVDCLLKQDETTVQARAALGTFDRRAMPAFAIKEFKAGALQYMIWLNAKLVTTNSIELTMKAISAVAARQSGRARTAIHALAEAMRGPIARLPSASGADPDDLTSLVLEHAKDSLATTILRGWRDRRTLVDAVEPPLDCVDESDLRIVNGLIEQHRLECLATKSCPLLELFSPRDLRTLITAARKQNTSAEQQRRLRALQGALQRHDFGYKSCRALGDAAFALLAPSGAEILTTNVKDHRPLAEALGKRAVSPHEMGAAAD